MAQAGEIDGLIDELIEREGGYVNHPADRGGPARFGITEAVARAHGFGGPMAELPREEAMAIYRRLYWLRPRFGEIAKRSPAIAAELFDTGANMGPAVAATFLQRALTAFNRNGQDYPDLVPDGRIHPGVGRTAAVPGLPAAARSAAQAAGQDRLPVEDALIATEQAIQLDELIRWVERQAEVDVGGR